MIIGRPPKTAGEAFSQLYTPDERATRLETRVRDLSRGFAEPGPPPAPMNRHQRRAEAARKRRAKQ